jgi:RHS repeat-associated protein
MNTLRPILYRSYVFQALSLLLFCLSYGSPAVRAQDAGVWQLYSQRLLGSDGTLVNSATVTVPYVPQTERAVTIKNVVSLNIDEENAAYIPDNFTASVTVNIDYGVSSTTFSTITGLVLTVTYNKQGGVSYNPKSYIHFSGSKYVKVTVTGVVGQALSNGLDAKTFLVLKDEMQVSRYFELTSGGSLQPTILSSPPLACSPVPDELPVSWSWPPDAGNNGTQLEWTWLEDELAPGTLDYYLLFKNNSTRVDLPLDVTSYNIPLFYDGQGKLYYRIRAVNNKNSGSRSDGPWSAVMAFPFCGHNNALNWQVNTAYAEDGKRKSIMQYYDGSLRMRQTVTKDNSTNTTLTAETFYDGQGRPAIQILPSPGINNVVAYAQNLNLFNNPQDGTPWAGDPAALFDLQPLSGGNNATPDLSTASGTALYYNAANPEVGQNGNGNIPDAGGYPYSVTRYTPDATGRIMSQSGVGAALKMTSGHETKYFYGSAPQEQLDGLFGTEVGNGSHYFKNMVQDANGQMSVSYVDMHGRTIATALAGGSQALLKPLELSLYPGQSGSTMNQNLLSNGANVVKGSSIESLTTLLVPTGELYSFTYSLNPDTLQLYNRKLGQVVCYDCMYNLEVSITDESGDQPAIVRKFDNVSLTAGNSCSPGNPAFKDDLFSSAISTVSSNVITFSQSLLAGSYSVRKTLTVSDAGKQPLRDQYLANAESLDEQGIIDSIYTVLKGQTGCALPVPPCQNCGTHMLATIRSQMLSDMMPYTGQYAKDPNGPFPSPITMYNTYDIFASGHFRSPLNSSGNFYYDAAGNVDASISSASLSTISAANFTGLFAPSWAQSLLPYHPEYNELLFAEQNLSASYDWIDNFNMVTTYGTSGLYQNAGGTSDDLDPFFAIATTAKTTIHNLETTGTYYNNLSIWQLAYGSVGCTTNPDPQTVDNCYRGAPLYPGASSSSPFPASLTTDQMNQVWDTYKTFYTSVRDSLVNVYIKDNGGGPDQDALVAGQYILRFPSSTAQVVQQYGFTGFPANNGDGPTISLTDATATAQSTRCSSYIDRWRQALSQCPTITSRSDAGDILTEITTRMEVVCEKGQDAGNPYGSSSVSPANMDQPAGADNSFEDVIKNVFAEKGLSTDQLCNPFVMDFPKPYGKNPKMTDEMMSEVDACACSQFTKMKIEAQSHGVDPRSITALNGYLNTTYQQTLTQVEFDALQHCSIIGTSPCKQLPTPCDDGGSGGALLGKTEVDANSVSPGCYITVCNLVTAYPLSSPQPKPSFLNCGFTGNPCVTCAQISSLTTDFKTWFAGQNCAEAPIFDATDLSSDQIGYNIIYADFINYRTGLQLGWMDYAKAATAASCNLAEYASNASANQNVVCPSVKPLSDASALVETDTVCTKARQMAIAMGHDIYEQRQAQLMNYFDAAYLSKCLSAKDNEHFSVTYDVKEYHYTLYYYDEAGNLVKTVGPKGARPDFSAAFVSSVETARGNGTVVRPAHLLTTDYRYNSLNLVVAQHTPDANTSLFWYDQLGRLVVSQNAQQAVDGKYSYTVYDAINRIVEVGQKPQSTAMSQAISLSSSSLCNWLVSTGGTREQVTSTKYDEQQSFLPTSMIYQENLRNRVSYTYTQDLITDANWNVTLYSYDVHGNVDTVLQDYNAVSGIDPTNQYKYITYTYDLVSNKVNGVDYQHYNGTPAPDAFYHRYRYDAENRLTQVLTSRDSVFWEQEAAYNYYKHGPLARMVLGQLQTQELRYSYTLQGWLKGVNSGGLYNFVADNSSPPPVTFDSTGATCPPGSYLADAAFSSRPLTGGPTVYTARSSLTFEAGFETYDNESVETVIDPGAPACNLYPQNASSGGPIPTDPLSYPIAQDAYNFSLHYYPGDYTPISATTPVTGVLEGIPSQAAPLFNGNIAAMALDLPSVGSAMVYNYHYDQLNRLTAMDAFSGLNTASHTFTPVQLQDYKEQASYDPNGNILTYARNGNQGGGFPMDQLTYNYNHATTNQLSSVTDAAGGTYTTDIKDQGTGDHYVYDQIGNLVSDGSNAITWTVYGKIASQTGNSGTVSYSYDAAGNRITKTASGTTTLYVRDAQGNVMSTYQRPGSGNFQQQEIDLYGSSRLGLTQAPGVSQPFALDSSTAYTSVFTRGLKSYELTNRLGNVLATITDKKIAVPSSGNSSLIDHYTADVVTAQDYYPFGMIMPGRSFVAAGAANYRYGFNGKEKDDEVKGVGNQVDYGMRVYDPRLGRFMSVDPITKKYPELTPYQFSSNRPIDGVDEDGLEWNSASTYVNKVIPVLKQDNTYILRYREPDILMVDIYGVGHIGPKSVVERSVASVRSQYYAAVGDNIRGGFFGATFYLAGGDRASFIGAAFDGVAMSFGGIPGETSLSPRYSGTHPAEPSLYKSALEITLPSTQQEYVDRFLANRPVPNYGVFYDKPLSTDALRVLSSKLGGLEVMQFFIKQNGNNGFYSVSYGSSGKIEVSEFYSGTPYLLDHVHPSGNTMPSDADVNLLKFMQQLQMQKHQPVQSSSTIVPERRANTDFNKDSKTLN